MDEVTKLETKMAFYFIEHQENITMMEEDKEHFRDKKICRFGEKNIQSDKIRDDCHLAGKYRGPAHTNCNINVH